MKKADLIYNQHEENNTWISSLNFYKDDLKFLENKLSEISTKYTDKTILSLVEHFQNQFIIQKNNIDEIMHNLKINEDKLRNEINKNIVAVDHRSINYHEFEKEQFLSFEINFKELRTEFIRFLAKWM